MPAARRSGRLTHAPLVGWQRLGEQRRPRLVAAAEDQTRISNEQTQLLAQIRNDVSTIKTAVLFWFVLSLVGLDGYVAVVNSR